MSYQVIARKWRPQTFEEVTGQEAITRTLRNAVEHERLHHAYIFSGARGVGKTTTARLLAKALNCHKTEKPNPSPCKFSDPDSCASCREIAESRSIDVLEFDAASHTGVDDIREIILESININPARDRYKIFIIDEVHMLSNSSFNALLKTLEEPPPNVAFIMATTELHKVPDTIQSRCQEFQFRTIPLKKIFDRLKFIAEAEKINIAEGALREIARSGEGSMRDAQSNFDQVISFSDENIEINDVVSALGITGTEMLTRIVSAIAKNQPSEALKVVDELISRGQDLRSFCRDLLSLFRDLLMVKIASSTEHLFDSALMNIEELSKFAEPFSESDFIRFFNSLSETESKLRDATQPRYVLEIGLVKLIEMRRVSPIETILERISNLEKALLNSEVRADNTIENPNTTENLNTAVSQTAEKKKLAVDFSLDEVPFPVKSSTVSSAPEAQISDNASSETVFTQPIEDDNFKEHAFFSSEHTKEENFQKAAAATASASSGSPITTVKTESNLLELIATMPSKLPPISAEELEHAEDSWLDTAYEEKLQRLGDNLFPIKNASEVAKPLLSSQLQTSNISEKTFGENGEGNRAASKINFDFPELNPEEISEEIPVLPENPTEEQLWQFASAHPLTKRVLRAFHGKIIEVKKL